MYIESIDIQNYHGISELHVDFHEGINLLIGNNGAGKTSLLNAIAVILQESFLRLSGVGFTDLYASDAYQTTTIMGDAIVNTERHYPIRIDSVISWENKNYPRSIIKSNESAIIERKEFEIVKLFEKRIGDKSATMPILCFLPAQRGKLKEVKTNTIQIAKGEPQRSQGYRNAFSGAQDISEIQQWCVQMDFAEYQKKKKIHEYTEFQAIISRFCSIMDDKAVNPKVYYSSEKSSLVYFDGADEKALYQLSDGFQAALCMIMELAYRAILLNPAMENTAKYVEGIVLIDEIEMHLHPAWQWIILGAFQQVFPKVQFIIATHSPIILSSANKATLLLMKSPNEVIELDSAYGYSIDDVLSLPQGTLSQPEKVKEYFDQIEGILESGTEEELNHLLEKAKEEFKDSPVVLKRILDFAEVNRWVEDA